MNNEHPENQWIRDHQKGDAEALGRLVEHFRRPLFAFIHNMIQGNGDAEEIFQEVWLRAIRNMNRYREKNFAGWLFQIARNVFIDRLRKDHRLVSPNAGHHAQGEDTDWSERIPDRQLTPDHRAAADDLGTRIREALAALPEDQREVFLMRSEAGLSFKEIGKIQGISVNTALSRMHYAVQKLRPMLVEDYEMLGRG